MKLQLEVLTKGKSFGQKIPVTLSQFIVGRDKSCHLRPASAVISKRHCAILKQEGKVLVRDFNSTNGTFVNDEQVDGEHELKNEDILKIGPLEFKVLFEKPATVSKPTPTPEKSLDDTDDDDVAAMLLSLGGDDASDSELGDDDIPGGSTLMDYVPTDDTQKPAAKEEHQQQDTDKKDQQAKKPETPKKDSGDSSSAAKAILEKYSRRQRP